MRRLHEPRALQFGLPATATLLIHQALISRPYIDDSYIFYRYAENWAHGLGPVFNRGEYVEGFSSFLWTLIVAAAASLGISPQHAAPALGIVLALASIFLLALITQALAPSRPWLPVLVPLGLACSPGFTTYASSGMDTALFAFVLLAAVAATARHVKRVQTGCASRGSAALGALLIGVLILTRAEGPIYALALAGGAFLLTRRASSPLRARLALPVAAVVGTCIVLLVRELVYGELTPATVAAKGYVGHLASHATSNNADLPALQETLGQGLRYAGLASFAALALVLAAFVVQRRRGERLSPLIGLGTLACLLGLVTVLFNGGDWMPYRRLLIPTLPLLILLAASAAATLAEPVASLGRRLRFVPAVGAGLGALVALAAGGLVPGATPSKYEAGQLRGMGTLLAMAAKPVPLLTNLAGVLPYYAGRRSYVWDMLGLTDNHNARQGYVFSPQFGRTDPNYDFTRRFGLFVSNSSWDFALMLASPDIRSREPVEDYQLFSKPPWAAIPLYVVAPARTANRIGIKSFCGCHPVPLSEPTRRRLLTELRARGAFPPALLDAARSHRFFPS